MNQYHFDVYPLQNLAGAEKSISTGFRRNKVRLIILTCANAVGNHSLKLQV